MNNQNTIKPGITLDMKARFFAQYYGQKVYNRMGWPGICVNGKVERLEDQFTLYQGENPHPEAENTKTYLLLTPLSDITDEDAIEVARLAHQIPKAIFNTDRSQKDIIYVKTNYSKVGIQHFISIRYKYATVCATLNFSATEKEKFSSNTVNIGMISLSSERPVPYIAIVDYLRSKGYALPWMGYSVEDMVQAEWIKLKEKQS